ncbi:site-specific tyrosine recombinase XerD [Bacteroidales bacterium Barb4]|nr:site-specific tyrosine recombinase XerD [Bacteroidales bacterium Barb4]
MFIAAQKFERVVNIPDWKQVKKMRSKAVKPDVMDCVLLVLQPANRLACRVSLATGLRIGDVLALKTQHIASNRLTVTEQKTSKRRRITIPKELHLELMKQAGRVYVFPNRIDYLKPRTRQAVYKDIKKAAKILRVGGKQGKSVSCHSMRKNYAKKAYNASGGNLKKVQELLKHDYESVTALYALCEELDVKR